MPEETSVEANWKRSVARGEKINGQIIRIKRGQMFEEECREGTEGSLVGRQDRAEMMMIKRRSSRAQKLGNSIMTNGYTKFSQCLGE